MGGSFKREASAAGYLPCEHRAPSRAHLLDINNNHEAADNIRSYGPGLLQPGPD